MLTSVITGLVFGTGFGQYLLRNSIKQHRQGNAEYLIGEELKPQANTEVIA